MKEVRDKTVLRAFLRRDLALHLYELGDLDDFFWPHTRWFALGEPPRAVVLLYEALALPVVVALGDVAPLGELIAQLRDDLPAPLYAHLSPGVAGAFAPRFASEPHGAFRKMILGERGRLGGDDAGVVRLGPADRAELEAFYKVAYPGSWFDPRMLETGQCVGIRERTLVAAAGVHVYSPAERVAALGNIAVAPDYRGRGLGARVTSAACRFVLAAGIDHVGLNVRADNRAAMACYERLGFTVIAPYEEHTLRDRQS